MKRLLVASAALLANTFLAYFVGTATLAGWMRQSPYDHPTPFVVMAVTTLLVFLDFTWFREQTCLVACPYGRWQSALLDRQSLIVAYDPRRGEPRGHGTGARPGLGDCLDCHACVQTCPTGIYIRDGLQLECIHCTQCADACDAMMVKVGRPTGLIRYTSQDALAGQVLSRRELGEQSRWLVRFPDGRLPQGDATLRCEALNLEDLFLELTQ